MIGYPWDALVTGIMLILAGSFTMIRHFLLEPMWTHYPKAPVFVRHAMFGFAVVLLFLGLRFMWVFLTDQGDTQPPQPGPALQLLSVALMMYKAAMLGNILTQKCPEHVWQRLERVTNVINCKDNKVLAWFRRV